MRRGACAGIVALFMLLACAAGANAGTTPARFSVGAATESIEPNAPISAGGFGIGAPIGAAGMNQDDPLQVRALYISNGRHAVAFVVADVQAFFPAYQEGPQYGTAA